MLQSYESVPAVTWVLSGDFTPAEKASWSQLSVMPLAACEHMGDMADVQG